MIEHYDAFISYRHAKLDSKIAERVQRKLEQFHVPHKLAQNSEKKKITRIFRDKDELEPYGPKELRLQRMRPHPGRTYNFNNQVALVHEQVHHLCGKYRENCSAQASEHDFAVKFNAVTSNCQASPWICWPVGWATKTYDSKHMAFIHAGKSTLGHNQYWVPERYRWLNK